MPRFSISPSQLPERLRYLHPLRRKFAPRRSEDHNEDTGYRPLVALLSKRIRGLSSSEAEQLLAEDLAALEEWLGSPANQNDPLQFVRGVALIGSPADLLKLIREEAEKGNQLKLRLNMELPSGAKLKRVQGADESGKLVTLKGLWMAINANTEDEVQSILESTKGPSCGWPEHSELSIQFGPVTGRKLVLKGETWRGPLKQIDYALAVPGGHVYASVSALGNRVEELNWDEADFEACLRTLRVEPVQPEEKH